MTSDVEQCWHWVTDADMHWPIMLAALSTAIALPGRVRNLKKFGPLFMGVNLGCAMRLVVILLGCFLLQWAVSSSTRMVWCLWAVLLLAEALALWMHWDLQRRLRKLDGNADASKAPVLTQVERRG